MTITLGVDQSYTNTGFVVMKDSVMVEFGTFKTTKDKDVYDRATMLSEFITAKASAHGVERINIEGLAFGIRGDATRDLAGLLFVVITGIRRAFGDAIPVTVVAPTSLKKFATGTGKSDKTAMTAAVPIETLEKFKEAKFKKTTGLTDIVDAYWLAKYTS